MIGRGKEGDWLKKAEVKHRGGKRGSCIVGKRWKEREGKRRRVKLMGKGRGEGITKGKVTRKGKCGGDCNIGKVKEGE